MSTHNHLCMYCGKVTVFGCPECGAACCMACGVNLCPVCVRIRLLQIERALLNRLVPWQHIEVLMVPIRSASNLFAYDADAIIAGTISPPARETANL
jgi:hypothetical protein